MSQSQAEDEQNVEVDDEYEAIYSKFRKNPERDAKFKEANDFHESRAERAAKRKAKLVNGPVQEEAGEPEDDFESRLQGFKTEMDKHIPLVDIPHQNLPVRDDLGRNRVNTWDIEEKKSVDTEDHSMETGPISEKEEHLISEKESCQMPAIDDVPPMSTKTDRPKLESVKPLSAGFFKTGARVHVNRVPSELIPPSSGSSVMGLYPHSSAWTKSPQWAQTIIGFAMGAIIGGLGFGLHKFVQKIMFGKEMAKNNTSARTHPREWNPEMMPG
jgi:hypothetical protein